MVGQRVSPFLLLVYATAGQARRLSYDDGSMKVGKAFPCVLRHRPATVCVMLSLCFMHQGNWLVGSRAAGRADRERSAPGVCTRSITNVRRSHSLLRFLPPGLAIACSLSYAQSMNRHPLDTWF